MNHIQFPTQWFSPTAMLLCSRDDERFFQLGFWPAPPAPEQTGASRPTARQSSELVRKAAAFLSHLGVKRRGDGGNKISLLLPNHSRIIGLPGTEATDRGFSGVRLLLVDEASRVDQDLYLAMLPVLAVSGGDIWLISTPFGQRGFFYRAWTEGGPD